LRELFRYANIALAVTLPVLFVGGILLRDAGEAAVQAFVLTIFVLGIALMFILEARSRRRRRRDQ
jgi:hypothetical protein